jgi:MFS family permease
VIKIIDNKLTQLKHILHGFFLSIATTIAEPATILPVIISYFTSNPLIIGLFSSLIKGGAILVQIFAAFGAQSYPRMMPYLYFVFATRFISWFSIGVVLITLGPNHPTLTLLLMGLLFFTFSLAAGFGTVYFNEIIAKVFTHKVRGRTTAIRQFVAGIGAISSGAVAGYILHAYEAPYSFGYLFIVSALIMLLGILSFATIHEPIKEKVSEKEKRFREYLKNTYTLFRSSKPLQYQISSYLLSYSYLFALPFIILDAKDQIGLDGATIGLFVSLQMSGAMISNVLWGYLSSHGHNRVIVLIAFAASSFTMIAALIGGEVYIYGIAFFIIGGAMDGFKLAFGNLIIILAPEDKRPIYLALQSNLTSLGLFFALPGAMILSAFGYKVLYVFTLLLLLFGFIFSLKKLHH